MLRHIPRALPLLLLAHGAQAAPLVQKLAIGGEAEPPGLLRPAAARPAVRYRFEVSPKSGGAPLRVTFSTWVPGNHWAGNGRLLIDFGDGAQAENPECFAPADSCIRPGQVAHVYAAPGVYRARFLNTKTGTLNAVNIRVGRR